MNINNIFDTDILGYVDFSTLNIVLNSIKIKDLEVFFNTLKKYKVNINNIKNIDFSIEDYSILCKILPLYFHEYTHFLDFSSTLWGLKYLDLMNNAYLCTEDKNKDERLFYKIKLFSDYQQRLRLPKYYTKVYENIENITPWRADFSMGIGFDMFGKVTDKPILFCRFKNFSDEILVRSPVSMVSILEASAMSQEIMINAFLLSNLSQDTKIVEEKRYNKTLLDYFYNSNITEYSVCFHILANFQNCPDFLLTAKLCSIITRIVLNFPNNMFEVIYNNLKLEELDNIPINFKERIFKGLEYKNLEIIFYLLSAALPKKSFEDFKNIDNKIIIAFNKLGISYIDYTKYIREEAFNTFSKIEDSNIKSVSKIAKAGYENFKLIDLFGDILKFPDLHIPPFFIDDSLEPQNIYNNKKNLLNNFYPYAEDLNIASFWLRNFSEACFNY